VGDRDWIVNTMLDLDATDREVGRIVLTRRTRAPRSPTSTSSPNVAG